MSQKGKLFFILAALSCLSLSGLFFVVKVWMPFMWFVLLPAVVCTVLWVYVDRKILAEFLNMRATKQGLNMGALIAIAVLFLMAINFLAARHYLTFDLSNNSVNSLSEQSVKILSIIDGQIKVKFFYKTGAEKSEENKKIFRDLIKRYQDVSSQKIDFEFVEMNEKAKTVKDFGATKGSGEAFIEYNNQKNRIENYNEQDFTNALIKLTRKTKKNIYFLEGHNERSIDNETSETSLFGFKQMLEKNSYVVKKLNLISAPDVPEDADAIVIADPEQNFQSAEIKLLENYLVAGGNVLLLLDKKETAGLEGVLKHLGIELDRHYIFNVFNSPMGQVVNAQAATVAVEYSVTNEITKMFSGNQMTVFRNPLALRLLTPIATMQSEVIVKTPESSVALTELDSKDYEGKPQSFNLGVNVKGKYRPDAKDFNIVVFSDADFVSNILLYQNINRDLALNSVSALLKETDLISVSPKEPKATKLLVSPPEFNQFFKFIVVGLFLPLPFLFMVISVVLWYRRRHA